MFDIHKTRMIGAGGVRLAFSGKIRLEEGKLWFQTGADEARLASSGKSI